MLPMLSRIRITFAVAGLALGMVSSSARAEDDSASASSDSALLSESEGRARANSVQDALSEYAAHKERKRRTYRVREYRSAPRKQSARKARAH